MTAKVIRWESVPAGWERFVVLIDKESTKRLRVEHAGRLHRLDPLLPPPVELLGETSRCIGVTDGQSRLVAVGAPSVVRPQPGSIELTWGTSVQHHLSAYVGAREPMAALDGLLGRWLDKVPAAEGDSSAVISWPSRDFPASSVFSRHGLLPLSCIAVRGGVTSPASAPETDATIRQATVDDLGDIVGLRLAEIRFAESFLATTERSFTRTRIREGVLEALQTAQPWVWVAERDSRVIGVAIVTPPEKAQWVAPMVSAPRPAYVDCVSVIAGRRGEGVGSALVAALQARLDQAGVVVSLLHHSLFNPLAAPFWARHGYRPLWMVWERRRVLG